MCIGLTSNLDTVNSANAPKDPRTVTVGMSGKNAIFTQRGKDPLAGFIRLKDRDGALRTITGFISKSTRTFYPYIGRANGALAWNQ
jgi:hypothetical protein